MRLLARGRTVNGDAAPVTYGATPHSPHTWDADAIQGCACDRLYYTFEGGTGDVPDYLGYACNLRACRAGVPLPRFCPHCPRARMLQGGAPRATTPARRAGRSRRSG